MIEELKKDLDACKERIENLGKGQGTVVTPELQNEMKESKSLTKFAEQAFHSHEYFDACSSRKNFKALI